MAFNGNLNHSFLPPDRYSRLIFHDARQKVRPLRPNRRDISMQPANNYTGFTRRPPPLSAYEHNFPVCVRSSTPVPTSRSRTVERKEDSDLRLTLMQKHLEAEQAKRMDVEKQIAVLTESYKTRIIGLESQLKECENSSSTIEELKKELKNKQKNELTAAQKCFDNLQQKDQELDKLGKRLEQKLRKYKSAAYKITAENKQYKKKLREADEREKSYRHSIIYNQAGNSKRLQVELESVPLRSAQREAEKIFYMQKLREQIDGLQICNDTLNSHIEQLEAEKKELKSQMEKGNEEFKGELERYKVELESTKSQNEQLKAINDGLQESSQKLMEIKKENSKLKGDLKRLQADLDSKADALYELRNKETERLMNSLAQNSGEACTDSPKVELEACQTELEKCIADLEKVQDDMIGIAAERDRFKEQLKIASENLEITEQKLRKAGVRMPAQECQQRNDEVNELMRKLDTCQEELENAKVDLQNCRDDVRGITAERDYVKEALEDSTQKFEKLNLMLDKELTQQRKAENEKLQQEIANSREVKAELVKAKKSIEVLSAKNEKLLTEWQRTSNLYIQSLTSQSNNDCKNFMDNQGPCPSMPDVVDEVIDLSDDDEMNPSKSKKNKQS
ncbi:major antigen-like isoform X1 [Ditylenchus destructor]|uniref:Major antigen-like isoform X1 n=1 Tax=Ditylenchus destructor TaxID=166010 RepID=A0AAD4MTK5_9BILA|nr:major antigen-like isoform X1 [Ditylenchus destructor]